MISFHNSPEIIGPKQPSSTTDNSPAESDPLDLTNVSWLRYLEARLLRSSSRWWTWWDRLSTLITSLIFPTPFHAPDFTYGTDRYQMGPITRSILSLFAYFYVFFHHWFKWSFIYILWLMERPPRLLLGLYKNVVIPAIAEDYTIQEESEMKKRVEWPPKFWWVRGECYAKFLTVYLLVLPLLTAYGVAPLVCNVWNMPADTENHVHWRAPILHPALLDKDPRAPYFGMVPAVWQAREWWMRMQTLVGLERGDGSWISFRRRGMGFRDDSEGVVEFISSRMPVVEKENRMRNWMSWTDTFLDTEAQLPESPSSKSRSPEEQSMTSKDTHFSATEKLILKDISVYKHPKFTNFHIDYKASQCIFDNLSISSVHFYHTLLALRKMPADMICAGPNHFQKPAPLPASRCQNLDIDLKGGMVSMCGAKKLGVELTCREIGDVMWRLLRSCRKGEKMGSGAVWLESKKGRATIIVKEAII